MEVKLILLIVWILQFWKVYCQSGTNNTNEEQIFGGAYQRSSHVMFSEVGACNYQAYNYSNRVCKENTFIQKFVWGDNDDTQPPEYMISIQLPKQVSGNWGPCFEHICGGALIAPNLIVTAAHCLDKFIGRIDQKNGRIDPQIQIYAAQAPQCRHETGRKRLGVISAFLHTDYDGKVNNDAAILEVMGSFTGPYVLYQPAYNLTLKKDIQLKLMGYGQQFPFDTMYNRVPFQSTTVKYANDEFCQQLVQQNIREQYRYDNMLCTYQRSGGSCAGDSGGPLVMQQLNNLNDVLIGIVSWGNFEECGKIGPVVFVEVGSSKINCWIDKILQQYGTTHGIIEWEKPASQCDGSSLISVVPTPAIERVLADNPQPTLESSPSEVPSDNQQVQQSEANALLVFKNSMKNSTNLISWKGSDACNNWLGISCTNNRVTNISLGGNFWEIVDNYSIFYASKPLVRNIGTSIPDQWSIMNKLQEIQLGYIGQTGLLPQWLSLMKDLKVFDVERGNLQGTIPPQYSTLHSLGVFNVGYNNLTGALPVELSILPKFQRFYADYNMLTGKLPPQYSTLVSLLDLYYRGNQLTGILPLQYSTLVSLQTFSIYDNSLTGMLPQQYSKLVNLVELRLSDNELTGSLPQQYSEFENLRYLQLQKNKLTGTVPLQYSKFGDEAYIYLFPQVEDLLCLDGNYSIVNDTDTIYC